MEEKQVEIVVEGKVQGVYFRKSTQEIAKLLDIRGFVENQSDGSVLINALGNTIQLDQFLTWCKSGPPSAEVTNLRVSHMTPDIFNSFEIR